MILKARGYDRSESLPFVKSISYKAKFASAALSDGLFGGEEARKVKVGLDTKRVSAVHFGKLPSEVCTSPLYAFSLV